MIRVVRGGFEGPEVGTKGRLGSGGAELGHEGSLVGSHLRRVLQASGDSRADTSEAQTLLNLRGLDRRGTGDGRQVAQIDTRAVLTGGGGYAQSTALTERSTSFAFIGAADASTLPTTAKPCRGPRGCLRGK